MNILHHKSWHVRNKDNILRVKRDEENARKEEEDRLRRVALAESEARTDLLRKKARTSVKTETDVKEEEHDDSVKCPSTSGHINFFSEIEQGKKEAKGNKEYEKEKREEKEKQEKAIGLLTYLGQSAVESQEEKPWYLQQFGTKRKREIEDEPTYKSTKESEEFNKKFKQSLDPLHMMNKYMDTKRKVEDKDYKPNKRPTYGTTSKKEDASLTKMKDDASGSEKKSDKCDKKKIKKKSKKSSHKKHKKEKKKKKKLKHHKRKHRYSKDRNGSSSSSAESNSDSNLDTDSSGETSPKNKLKPKPSSSGTKSMAELRAERLKREQTERLKTKRLFYKMSGVKDKQPEEEVTDDRDRQYNSVFNPEFVRKRKRRKTDYSDFQ